MPRISPTATRGASVLVYAVLLAAALLEKVGKTTSDTKTPLIEAPGAFLRSVVHLWNADTSLGEIQNQAYGYLFPQGPFFLLGELASVPPWVTERLWAVLVLAIGCEGARLVARAMGLSAWPAWVAGMAYGLNPRVISQVATRSAEVLPGQVLPWVLLPIVLAMTGRLPVRRAALFSAAAFAFSGGVNGTATGAPLVLVLVVLAWGIRTHRASWALLGWWSGLVAVTSIWWIASLLRLNAYSPPFFDYVEDTSTTTGPTGYESSLRGMSNWVDYTFTGAHPSWPAGADLAFDWWLVLATGLVAAIGVLGLCAWRSPWRTPLALSAAFALCCLTIGHASALESPAGALVRDLLDGPFALLRNVHKIDPPLRLPLAIGVGAAFAAATRWSARHREWARWAGPGVVAALVFALAQPAIAFNLRTPGWDEVPDYWEQTAAFLDHEAAESGESRAWVVPGSGFGVQTWGWTMDEPMAAVATTPWFTRSQVPLVPPQTIRVLSRLEGFLETGSGSPNLGTTLSRIGVGHVVVRHDLDPSLSEATGSNLVSIALARSPGVERVAEFGALDFGPAVEVYAVRGAEAAADVALRPESEAVTVAGASPDVVDAVGAGLIAPDQVAVVQGDDGWDRPADIVGDSYRLRERDFGRVHDAESHVLAPDEPRHSTRKVGNYPANTASRPLVAEYDGVDYVDASSSQAYVGSPAGVLPETAPAAAIDGDRGSGWRPAYFGEPRGQWLEVRFDRPRRIEDFTVVSSIGDRQLDDVTRWRVSAGGRTTSVDVDPFTGEGEGDLDGVTSDTVRFTVDRTQRRGGITLDTVALLEIEMDGLPAERTMVVPESELDDDVDFLFSAQPETRACITTLLAPDCRFGRRRPSEESVGIDRTFTVPSAGVWSLRGTALARSRPSTAQLLDPLDDRMRVTASSSLAGDPTVSGRMSYDANPTTSWIADPYDPSPSLTVDLDRPRRVDRLDVTPPPSSAVIPTEAVLRGGGETRRIDLSGLGSFKPITADHFVITFKNPTRGLAPLGLSELSLEPGGSSVQLFGEARTGSVCGYGPNVEVDGTRYLTRVDGVMGNVVSAGPLEIVPCRGGPIRLTAGEHRLRLLSTEQFQPVVAILERDDAPPAPEGRSRDLDVLTDDDTHQVLEVGAGDAAILATARNFNRGWEATLDGRPLDVQRVDGWAQGWRLPAGRAGTVEITYAPERSYVAVLVGGLAVTGLALLLALALLTRTRLAPGAPPADRPPGAAWPTRRRLLVAVLAGPVLWVLGGVPAVAALVLAGLLRLLRLPLLPGAGALLVAAAGAVAAWAAFDEPDLAVVADGLAGTGFVLAVLSIGLLHRPPPGGEQA
jgi:arabinofuranan 3-O-arabinosyltransferase